MEAKTWFFVICSLWTLINLDYQYSLIVARDERAGKILKNALNPKVKRRDESAENENLTVGALLASRDLQVSLVCMYFARCFVSRRNLLLQICYYLLFWHINEVDGLFFPE